MGEGVGSAAASVRRELARMARPTGEFDAARYFRGDHRLRFHNVGTAPMRALAKRVFVEHRERWTLSEAIQFADRLMADKYLEVKSVGIEVVALYRRAFTPRLLGVCKGWLARGLSANWATADAICGSLVGPLLAARPELLEQLRGWAHHRNLWVRRASVVALIPAVRTGAGMDLLYENAAVLHRDSEDLIQKAVGWALREAGKQDMPRLERYLRSNGPSMPRTTVRYAIERFPVAKRRELLSATRTRRTTKPS
jgi:3-methyladenine DNA glycosylase AlkD